MIKISLKNIILSTILTTAIFSTPQIKALEDINKFSTEITYKQDQNIIRFRPFDYTSPDTQRQDFLIGKSFGDNLTIYGYWKSDNKNRDWIGTRVDLTKKVLKEKFTVNMQFSFFRGLNEKSSNEIYFIPSVDYKLGKKITIGAFAYGKKTIGKEPFFYIGPCIGAKITNRINTLISYDRDIFTKNDMLYWKTGVNIGEEIKK